jgi:hypothetical protein
MSVSRLKLSEYSRVGLHSGSGREPTILTTGSFFTCDFPLCVNVMNKQINISLNTTLLDNRV